MASISIEFKDADIRDILRAISAIAKTNIATDATVEGKMSIRLQGMSLYQALDAVLRTGGYHRKLEKGVFYVSRNPFPEAPSIVVDGSGKVSIHAQDAKARDLLLEVSRKTGVSVVPSAEISESVTLELQCIPAKDAITAIAKAAGLSCDEESGICYIRQAPLNLAPRTTGLPGDPLPSPPDLSPVGSLPQPPGTLEPIFADPNAVSTRLVRLKYLKATEVLGYLSKQSGNVQTANGATTPVSPGAPEVRATKDDSSIVITGTRDSVAGVLAEIEQIDIAVPQVTLEAQIVELYNSKDKNVGLVLGRGSSGQATVDLAAGELTYASGRVASEFKVMLKSLVEKGDAKVVASPSICTLTGHEANIDIGQVRYFKVTNYGDSGQPGSQPNYYPYSTIQTINAGITLKITPWVGATGEITATIEPEVSTVTGITADGLPELNRRKAKTMIRVKDGDSIIIGGLKQQERTRSVSKTPLLGDLPIVGAFFRNTKVVSRDTDLVIMITPRIHTVETIDAGSMSDGQK